MSLIYLNNGPADWRQATFSLWFKVPAISIQKCADAATQAFDNGAPYPQLNGFLPLVTWGSTGDTGTYSHFEFPDQKSYTVNNWFGSGISGAFVYTLTRSFKVSYNHIPELVLDDEQPIDPSFIGLYCSPNFDQDGNPDGTYSATLHFNINSSTNGDGSAISTVPSFTFTDQNECTCVFFLPPFPSCLTDTAYDYAFKTCITDCVGPAGVSGRWHVTNNVLDVTSDLDSLFPAAFVAHTGIPVQPEVWHHLVVSFDMDHETTGVGTGSTDGHYTSCPGAHIFIPGKVLSFPNADNPCKISVALDGQAYSGEALLGTTQAQFMGPNGWSVTPVSSAIQTDSGSGLHDIAWDVAGVVEVFDTNGLNSPATYTMPAMDVLSTDFSFGIPAQPELADNVLNCAMAEFYMWSGLYNSDAGKLATALIKPNGKPVATGNVHQALGVPTIEFHKSINWEGGINTGTYGRNATVQFPVLSYDPDPQLGVS